MSRHLVTLYERVPEWGGWTPWPAHLYNSQANPQVTGSDGYFAFFTPPGQYYLQVDGKPGYQPWRSPVITVVNEIVHVNVPFTPWTEPSALETMTEILLTAGGPQPANVTVQAGATVQWRGEVDGLLLPAELAALAGSACRRWRKFAHSCRSRRFTEPAGANALDALTPGCTSRLSPWRVAIFSGKLATLQGKRSVTLFVTLFGRSSSTMIIE